MRQLAAPAACSRASYGRVLTADIIGDLVITTLTSVGGVIGGAVDGTRRSTIAGGVAGFLLALYPALAARRATIRSANCSNPGMGRILAYSAARIGVGALANSATRRVAPVVGPWAAGTALLFLAPIAGKRIVQT